MHKQQNARTAGLAGREIVVGDDTTRREGARIGRKHGHLVFEKHLLL